MTHFGATLSTTAAVVHLTISSHLIDREPRPLEVSIRPTHAGIDLGPPVTVFLFQNDLDRLVSYLEDHMGRLLADSSAPDPFPYAPLELGFQLQALSGDVETPIDGSFGLAFAVRRPSDGKLSDDYYGFEGTVDVTSVNRFCAEQKIIGR